MLETEHNRVIVKSIDNAIKTLCFFEYLSLRQMAQLSLLSISSQSTGLDLDIDKEGHQFKTKARWGTKPKTLK